MPAILIPIAIFLGKIASSLVGRVLLALGLGVITHIGFNSLMDLMTTEIIDNFQGITADMAGLLIQLQVDKAMSVILSAYAVRWAIRAAMGATRKLGAVGD